MFGLPQLPSFGARRRNVMIAATPVRRRRDAGRAVIASVGPPIMVADSTVDGIQRALAGALGGQVTVGGVAGFATGYATKRIGQMLLFVVGLEIVAMQAMAQRGWISVDWDAIGKELSPHVEKDGLERALEAVKHKMPFAGAFGAGCLAGLKWS